MTQTITDRPSITFAVDEVKPAARPLEECRAYEAVREMLGSHIESCNDYHSTVVTVVHYQPLLAAVYTAFSEHRPLVLSPDAVWVTIAQGVAHHMAIHGERLRSRFVSHQGKLELAFDCTGWVEKSPENPWPEAFASWSSQIRDHVGPAVHGALACDFSTTGPVERAVSDIVTMDVFERYFHYIAYCICGIPSVTLEGTPGDWDRLRAKAAGLKIFDLDWWLEHLLPICDQFARASRGDVDMAHWRDICKLRSAYGGDIINGWVARLFPYLQAFIGGPCSRRNAIFENGEGFQTFVAPSGLSRVPFTWRNLATGRERAMEAIGGLVGMTQDPQTLALRPKVGWAVRVAEKRDVLLARLAADHATFPGLKQEDVSDRGHRRESMLPADLCKFYDRTDGAELFGRSKSAGYRLEKRKHLEPLNWGELPARHTWHRLASLPNGTWLAINLDHNIPDPRPKETSGYSYDPLYHPVCQCQSATRGKSGKNPVIALSFTELLERLLDSGGKPFWLEPAFVGYGDAEQYTRRS